MVYMTFMAILEWLPLFIELFCFRFIKVIYPLTSIIIILFLILSFTKKIKLKKILLMFFLLINFTTLINSIILFFFTPNIFIIQITYLIGNFIIYKIIKKDINKNMSEIKGEDIK